MKTNDERVRKDAAWLKDVLNNSGNILNFPTYFQSAVRLKNVLRDPNSSRQKIVATIAIDPMMSARVVQMANTAKYYQGSEVSDLATAVSRVGTTIVKRLAIEVALKQLSSCKGILEYHELSRTIWLHSLEVASAANVIAQEFDGINPYEAEFAGLVSNLGAFYLLYRAAMYEPIAVDREKVKSIVSRYYEEAGLKILKHLDMPIDIMDAVETSPLEGYFLDRIPRSMREVVYIARIMADAKYLWRNIHHQENMVGSVFMELGDMIDQRSEENRKLYDR
jgi:HD-like signal output (HDOD) protein